MCGLPVRQSEPSLGLLRAQRIPGFDPWLTSLGLKSRLNDRIHAAFSVLRKAEEVSRNGHEKGVYSDVQTGDWFPLIEALEAHDVSFLSEVIPLPRSLRC